MPEKLLTKQEIINYKNDGAVVLRKKFNIHWIKKLKKGIDKDLKSPSPRLVSHTKETGVPSYFEDYWSWNLFPEFKDFVFNSQCSQIASELLSAKRINLVMDNWFLREAGSKSQAPFHHDISYFDFNGLMCVLWLPLEPVKKEEFALAYNIFSNIVEKEPDWAEGWNKRATVLYLMNNYQSSLEDIEEVLILEPRHFGALSGQALVYIELGQYEKAIKSYKAAQKIYPIIDAAKKMIPQLEELIKNQAI